MKEKVNKYQLIRVVACLILLVLSITVFTPMASKPETYRKTIEKLDEKKETIMKVTATATVSSIALAVFPDDATTPVANKIMDMAGYLVIVLCAIVMEKYLLTIAGYLAFHWLIPIACLLFGINTFSRNKMLTKITAKILLFSIVIMMVVPVSVRVSNLIEETYKISIDTDEEESLFETEGETSEVETSDQQTEQASMAQTEEADASTEETEESGGWLSRTFSAISGALEDVKDTSQAMVDKAVDAAENAVSAVTSLSTATVEKAQNMFWDLVEKVVVLIVTNCLLPILVLMFMIWVVNMIMGLQIHLPDPRKRTHKMHWTTED